MDQVVSVITKLKMGKAAGICGIRPEFIRYGGPPVAVALHWLFRSLWLSENIPSDWRRGIILPLYKARTHGLNVRITVTSYLHVCK